MTFFWLRRWFVIFYLFFSSRSIKRRKFDDELVESSLGAAFGTPVPKTPRTRTQSLNMTSTSSGVFSILFLMLSLYLVGHRMITYTLNNVSCELFCRSYTNRWNTTKLLVCTTWCHVWVSPISFCAYSLKIPYSSEQLDIGYISITIFNTLCSFVPITVNFVILHWII